MALVTNSAPRWPLPVTRGTTGWAPPTFTAQPMGRGAGETNDLAARVSDALHLLLGDEQRRKDDRHNPNPC